MRHLPWIGGAVLAGGAVFSYAAQPYVLVGVMLFFPFLDRAWRVPALPRALPHIIAWLGLMLAAATLMALKPQNAAYALSTLAFAALPEEWFFRAYFMTRLRAEGWRANLVTSLLFTLLHVLARGEVMALLVFAPSLFYGWLYQRTRDLPLLVLAHALSNLVYITLLADFVKDFLEGVH